MHCVAGDGLGILVAAAALAPLHLPPVIDLVVEYVVGFGFGWTIFQALFMRDMAGSYRRSLRNTFLPEMVSMNGVMAAMAAVSVPWKGKLVAATRPSSLDFWFVMSIALCAGFLVAYPINWWLVAKGLKHGMKTVMPGGMATPLAAGLSLAGAALGQGTHPGHHRVEANNEPRGSTEQPGPSRGELTTMVGVSFVVLAAGVAVAGLAGSLLGG